MAKQKPDHDVTLTVETVADELVQAIQQASEMSNQAIVDLVGSIPTTQEGLDALHAAYTAKLTKEEFERAVYDAQNPIVYRYNGNAAAGESMAHVPLADIRQSLWAELEPYMQAGVAASPLFTKVEVANG